MSEEPDVFREIAEQVTQLLDKHDALPLGSSAGEAMVERYRHQLEGPIDWDTMIFYEQRAEAIKECMKLILVARNLSLPLLAEAGLMGLQVLLAQEEEDDTDD